MSTTEHATQQTHDEPSRRKFVEPTIVRHGRLARVTAQGPVAGGIPAPVVMGTEPTVMSSPAIGVTEVR